MPTTSEELAPTKGGQLEAERITLGREITEAQRRKIRVLRLLAESGPLNKYSILHHKGTGSKPTMFSLVKELENDHLIRVDYVNRHARGGRISKYYEVTVLGLVMLIAGLSTPKDRKLIGELASKYRGVEQEPTVKEEERSGPRVKYSLYIFDLWPSIEKAGVSDLVALNLVCTSPGLGKYFLKDSPFTTMLDIKQMQDKALLDPIYSMDSDTSFYEAIPSPGRLRYIAAVMKQPDLRVKMIELLLDLRERVEHKMELMSKMRSDINRVLLASPHEIEKFLESKGRKTK